MDLKYNGLTPADFADTAQRAVAACEGKTVGEQAGVLASDGLLGICASEEIGGLAMPLAFALPVVQAGGGALLRFPLIETLLLASTIEGDTGHASAIVAGDKVATVAWASTAALEQTGDGFRVTGTVARAPFADEADLILIHTTDGRGVLVDAKAPGVSVSPSLSLDVVHPEFTVRLDGLSISSSDIVAVEQMAELEHAALVLRTAAIVGASEACIALAEEHATTRKQFGKPLIANQAIRHHLARHKLALESARVVLDKAAAPGAPAHSARSAFATAVTGGIAIGEGAIQIHGGMGFTWEVPLHFHLRHIRALEAQADAGRNLDLLAASYIASVAPMSAAA